MKHNYKILIGVLIGIILSVSFTAVADTLIQSKDVNYSNSESGGTYADVQDAIDELYKRAGYTNEVYKEDILNGADPVLGDGMIPVYIADNGDVYYADSHTKWYSYNEKRWANAVILSGSAKKTYKSGDKIEESDIESYFVWIPRYAYKIWNLGEYDSVPDGGTLTDKSYETSISKASNNARIIDVVFGTNDYLNNNLQKCKSLTWSPEIGEFSEPQGIAVGDYLIHPGFTLGDTELNGLWVGKFETSGGANNIQIKPNKSTWRYATLKTFFDAYLEYKENLKSHMIKNTEWGAVAYLSHSAYGKGSEVNINNASDCKTGYSAAPDTDQSTFYGTSGTSSQSSITQPWNTATGYLASTTGNITGVYDMAGGTWEYIAATMINNANEDKSGFTQEEVTKYMKQGYIDAYSVDSNITSYSKRILGDATGEMGPFYNYHDLNSKSYHNSWYADLSNFILPGYSWFNRGGGYRDGVIAGQFFFVRNDGSADTGRGSRLVLVTS